jgi:hypothetical protein
MNERRSFLTGLLGLGGLSSVRAAAAGEPLTGEGAADSALPVFFAYRNVITKFMPTAQEGSKVSFAGADLGTVEGGLTGTILQSFSVHVDTTTGVSATGPDDALFTDRDRDQINFQYAGTGQFLPPGGLMSVGGVLTVTYTVVGATGKYAFLIGRKFPAKVTATNGASGSAGLPGAAYGPLGAVYGEIYSFDAPSIARILAATR